MFKKFVLVMMLMVMVLVGCSSDADTASYNLSQAADNFEITRRIIFYNGITGEYMLVVEGLCSLGNNDPAGELSVTCKTGHNEYMKHFLGLSDNVSYFAQQLEGSVQDVYRYRVIYKPESILPDIEFDIR